MKVNLKETHEHDAVAVFCKNILQELINDSKYAEHTESVLLGIEYIADGKLTPTIVDTELDLSDMELKVREELNKLYSKGIDTIRLSKSDFELLMDNTDFADILMELRKANKKAHEESIRLSAPAHIEIEGFKNRASIIMTWLFKTRISPNFAFSTLETLRSM